MTRLDLPAFGLPITATLILSASSSSSISSGKYSQSFLDQMAYGVSYEIEKAMGVVGLSKTSIRLEIPFVPETYMEHTSDNVTYRRLLISDKTSLPKDLWIKWRRLDSSIGYSARDNVKPENISFELGEDVPQKIREKEYRFLTRVSADKYQSAMGRKNVTEWRELIKRALRRGDLEKIAVPAEAEEKASEVNERLDAILEKIGYVQPQSTVQPAPAPVNDDELLDALLKAEKTVMETEKEDSEELSFIPAGESLEIEGFAVNGDGEDESLSLPWETEAGEEDNEIGELLTAIEKIEGVLSQDSEEDAADEQNSDSVDEEGEEIYESSESEKEDEEEPVDELADEDKIEEIDMLTLEDVLKIYGTPAEEESEDEDDSDVQERQEESAPTVSVDIVNAPEPIAVLPDVELSELVYKLREEKTKIETELLLRFDEEREKRVKLEGELSLAVSERDSLMAENLRLAETARRATAELERETERHRTERDKLVSEIEGHVRAQEREKNRLAEAALAEIEQMRRKEEENARLEAERVRLIAERERQLEDERIEREREAERERIEAESNRQAAVIAALEAVSCTSYVVKLIFRNNVDPNYITKIGEYIKTTVSYFKKEHLKIRVRASMPEPMTVQLDFTNIPDDEHELVVNIIKVLGNSKLGIVKAILD